MNKYGLLALSALALAPHFVAGQPAAQETGARTHQLRVTPKTVAWGYYDAAAAPVLRIKSGDTVELETLLTNSPTGLEWAGVKPADVEQSLRDVFKEVTKKGPGGHILTGPIYVEGAERGDALEVRIQSIKLAIPYAYNSFGPRTFCAWRFPQKERPRSSPSTKNAWSRNSARESRFPCIPSSAAWG